MFFLHVYSNELRFIEFEVGETFSKTCFLNVDKNWMNE